MCTYNLQCVHLSNYKFLRGLLTELKITVIQSMIKRLYITTSNVLNLLEPTLLIKHLVNFVLHKNLFIEGI